MMAVKTVLPFLLLASILEGSSAGLSVDEPLKIASNDDSLEKKVIHHALNPVKIIDQVTDIKHSNGKYVAPTETAIKLKPQVLGNAVLPASFKPKPKKIKANNVAKHTLKVKPEKKKSKARKGKKNKSKRGKRFRKTLRKALRVLQKKVKKTTGKLQKGKDKKQARLLKIPSKKWKPGNVSKVIKNRKNKRNWRKGRKFPRRRLRLLKWRKRKGKPKRKIMKGKKIVPGTNTLNNLKDKPHINLPKEKKGLQRKKAIIGDQKGQQIIKERKGRKGKSMKGKLKKQPRNLKPGKKRQKKRKIGRANALKSVLRYLQRRNRKRKMPTGYLRRLIGIPSKKFKGKMDMKKINLKDLIQKHANKIPVAKARNIEQKIKNIIKNARPIKKSLNQRKSKQKMKGMEVAKIQDVLTKPGVKKVLSEA